MEKDLPNVSLASCWLRGRLLVPAEGLPQRDLDSAALRLCSCRSVSGCQKDRRDGKFPDQERDPRKDKGPNEKVRKSVSRQAI